MTKPVILPTDDVISEFYRLSQEMQTLEFDLYECVRIVLDSLNYANRYPHSFEQEVMLSHENRAVESMTIDDVTVLNRMMRLLYDRIYTALCAMRLYDPQTGQLHYEHFEFDHGNIMVWTKPFVHPPVN